MMTQREQNERKKCSVLTDTSKNVMKHIATAGVHKDI